MQHGSDQGLQLHGRPIYYSSMQSSFSKAIKLSLALAIALGMAAAFVHHSRYEPAQHNGIDCHLCLTYKALANCCAVGGASLVTVAILLIVRHVVSNYEKPMLGGTRFLFDSAIDPPLNLA